MNEEDKSILALNRFKSALKDKEKYGNEGFKFKGLVVYNALGKEIIETLECVIIVGGYKPMFKINTDDKGKLIKENIYHLDFNPFYSQNTLFIYNDINRTFIIDGKNSPKLGNYKITVSEVINP